jgi:beta-lactamase regulating signal transducer with metallopeptidase domain
MLFWLAQNTIFAGLLAVVVAIGCRVCRFRPAVQHALWLVVLVKLVTPPLVAWPGVAFTLPEEEQATAEARPENYQILVPSTSDLIVTYLRPMEGTSEDPLDPAQVAPIVVEAEASAPPRQPASQNLDWLATCLLRVIVLGGAALALLQLIRIGSFQRLLRRGRDAPAALSQDVARLAARLRVRPPQVRVLPGIASPLVCGLGRPLLLWPEALCDRLSSLCQRAVIVHELAHLRRRDHWVAWLRAAAGCLWWWNPLYWFVFRQLGRNAELACDAWVIGTLPDARRAYAEALLAVAGLSSKTAVPAPAVGMRGSRRDFERRLIMVMRDSVPCKAPVLALVAVGVLAVAILPGLSLGQKPEKPSKVTTPEQLTTPAPVQVNSPYIVESVFTNDLQNAYVIAQAAPGDERERKLKDLEDKLQALLKEVKSLRDNKPTQSTTATVKPKISTAPQAKATWKIDAVESNNFVWGQGQPLAVYSNITEDKQHAVTLSRTTYKLPKEKADALAAFLPHIKASVLESKVEGDGIVVTTTPEVQHTISQLVALMLGKPQTHALQFHYTPAVTTTPQQANKP